MYLQIATRYRTQNTNSHLLAFTPVKGALHFSPDDMIRRLFDECSFSNATSVEANSIWLGLCHHCGTLRCFHAPAVDPLGMLVCCRNQLKNKFATVLYSSSPLSLETSGGWKGRPDQTTFSVRTLSGSLRAGLEPARDRYSVEAYVSPCKIASRSNSVLSCLAETICGGYKRRLAVSTSSFPDTPRAFKRWLFNPLKAYFYFCKMLYHSTSFFLVWQRRSVADGRSVRFCQRLHFRTLRRPVRAGPQPF
jgi:hypothetical protein